MAADPGADAVSDIRPALEEANPARMLTDALVKRHQQETEALQNKEIPADRHEWREHSLRQARELLDHAYDMERRLHEMWLEYRWT